jgi:hypothetical protein
MKLAKDNLVDTLKGKPKKSFPGAGNVSYFNRYEAVAEFLANEIHPHVAMGALLSGGDYLNDHGPGHIAAVISRASALVGSDACKLTSYELYLLLVAIQVHDVGNILGRIGHEQQPKRLSVDLDAKMGPNAVEKRLIFDVAAAHGGDRNGNRDTIAYLPPIANVLNQRVRPQFLAAIVRLADELADDQTRAARFPLENGVLPRKSQVFHEYSKSLQSVIIDLQGRDIQLDFELSAGDLIRTFGKLGTEEYLIEEILARTQKMHRERMYCMRFLAPDVKLDRITVTVRIYHAPYNTELKKLGWRLEEKGYPGTDTTIYELCPELETCVGGARLTGAALRDLMVELTGATDAEA